MKSKEISRSFLSGVLVLTAANLLTKVIGLVFKIPLTEMLGNEGMGYFNTAYQIYTWLYMLSTAGVPVALSMMVSEFDAKGRRADSKRILAITLIFFSILGALGSTAMMLGCKGLSSFIKADKAFLCILAIAPALFFVCVSSTVRGYFQGKRNMVPTAVSEIIESTLKMGVGILLGLYALSKGYPIHKVAAYAILGVTIGVAASAIFLSITALISKCFQKTTDTAINDDNEAVSNKKLLVSFFAIALPIMLSSSLLSMSSMFDTLIIIRRLQVIGFTEEASVALYGNYTAFCVTLFNLPPVLIYPIVNTLLPSLCAARVAGNGERAQMLTDKSLKFSAIIALPCALGLGVMSAPILKLIFSSAENAEMAAPLLSVLAPSVFLIGVMAVTNGLLQASRLQRYSVLSMVCGAAVKGVSAYFLPSLTLFGNTLGIYAAPISTFLFYLTITVMNFIILTAKTDLKISVLSIYLRPLAAAVICTAVALGVQTLLTSLFGQVRFLVLFSISVAAAVYLLMLLLFKAVTKEDIELVPKLCKITEKLPVFNKLIK